MGNFLHPSFCLPPTAKDETGLFMAEELRDICLLQKISPKNTTITIDGKIKKLLTKTLKKNKYTDVYLLDVFDPKLSISWTHVLSTCQGITPFHDLVQNSLSEDNLSFAERECFESNDLEPIIPNTLSFGKTPTEAIAPITKETPISDLFDMFQDVHCKHQKGVCNRKHYIIGEGSITNTTRPYTGIFLCIYPDFFPNKEGINSIVYRYKELKKTLSMY